MIKNINPIAVRLKIDDCVNAHKACISDKKKLEFVDKTWIDNNGYLCIKYSSGEWFHYGCSRLSGDIVWW